MRTPEDGCLLCYTNKAAATDSHIVSKFLGKTMFGSGNQKRAFAISTNKSHLRPRVIQDSAKQSYILCQFCEDFFEVLETHVSRKAFSNIRDSKRAMDYQNMTSGAFRFKYCLTVDPRIFQLFVFSIFWRCSISTEELFNNFKLESAFEEEIRQSLISYRVDTAIELHELLKTTTVELASSKFAILTHDGISDPTSGAMTAMPTKGEPYRLLLNEYWMLLSRNTNKDQESFSPINNMIPSIERIRIGVFNETDWKGLHTRFISLVKTAAVRHAFKIGKEPYLLDDSKLEAKK